MRELVSIEEKKKRKSISNKKYREAKILDTVWAEKERERCIVKQRRYYNDNKDICQAKARIKQSEFLNKLRSEGTIRDYEKRKREKSKEYDKNYKRKWVIKNSDRLKIKHKKYASTEKGKEIKRNSEGLRRAKRRQTDIDSSFLIELKMNTKTCEICSCELNDYNRHLDHILPLCINGMHVKSNVRFVCNQCNMHRPRKGEDLIGTKYEYMLIENEK